MCWVWCALRKDAPLNEEAGDALGRPLPWNAACDIWVCPLQRRLPSSGPDLSRLYEPKAAVLLLRRVYYLWAEAAGHPPAFSWPQSRRLLCLRTAIPGSSRSGVSRDRINTGPGCTLACFIASETAPQQCWSTLWKPWKPLLCMYLPKRQSLRLLRGRGDALLWPRLKAKPGLLLGHSQG